MNADAREYFLQHGTIEGYYEKKVKDNDRKWFLTMIVMCLIFIGFYVTNNKTQADVNANAHRIADTLQAHYQAKLDSIVLANDYDPSKKLEKCKTDQHQEQ